MAASASNFAAPLAGEDVPDTFFDLTAEDYAAWSRANEAKKKVCVLHALSVLSTGTFFEPTAEGCAA
jgi:hypothetical protein